MKSIRLASRVAGIVAVSALVVGLILEATEVTNSQWRASVADRFQDTVYPTWPLWASALVGIGLALVGVAVVAAQFAPERKGFNSMHEVYRSTDGDTRIRGRAAIRAAQHELDAIDGVVETAGRIQGKSIHVEVKVDDRANFADIETEARTKLGHEFWINLGLAEFALNLVISHHPQPPRVR